MGRSADYRIKEIRLKKNVTQEQLASAIGVSNTSIKNYESGATTPSRERMLAIAAALDVPASALIGTGRATEPSAKEAPTEPQKRCQNDSAGEPPKEQLFEIANRMCMGRTCDECIIGNGRAESDRLCVLLGRGVDVEGIVAAMRQWAIVNPPAPKRSYMDDFFEKFPDAPRREDGAPLFAVNHIYNAVAKVRQDEFQRLTHIQRWSKPVRYWEEEK